jgi:hypothetical protein
MTFCCSGHFAALSPKMSCQAYPFETDLQAALAQKPDAVIVSNPTALHLEVAIPACAGWLSSVARKTHLSLDG